MLSVTFVGDDDAKDLIRPLTDEREQAHVKITVRGIAVDLFLSATEDWKRAPFGPVILLYDHKSLPDPAVLHETRREVRAAGRGFVLAVVGKRGAEAWPELDGVLVDAMVAEPTVDWIDGDLLLRKAVLDHFDVLTAATAVHTASGISAAPRSADFAYAHAWLAAARRGLTEERQVYVVPVALSAADITSATKADLPPAVKARLLAWLPKKGRSAALLKELSGSGRAFFHASENGYSGAREWLAGLGYGIVALGAEDEGAFDEGRAAGVLGATRMFDARYVLVPWHAVAAASQRIEASAVGAAVRIRQVAPHLWRRPSVDTHDVSPVWITYAGAFEHTRATADFEDAASVRTLDGVPEERGAYIFKDAQVLGQGSYGCVLRIPHPGGSDAAIKVQAVAGAAGEVGGRHEIGLTMYVQKAVYELTHTSPYIQRIYDGYVTKPLPGLVAGVAPQSLFVSAQSAGSAREAAKELARVIARECEEIDVKSLAKGLVVTELMFATGGDLSRASADSRTTASNRIAWMFELVHGLVAMHHVLGFVHMDIKTDNVLMFAHADIHTGGKSPVLRIRTPRGGDVVVRDANPFNAVLVDFGLSMTQAPGPRVYGAQGPKWSREGSAETPHLLHSWGTLTFLEPTAIAYFNTTDPNMPGFGKGASLARGLATDVWALGLTLISMWLEDEDIGAEPWVGKEGDELPWAKGDLLAIAGRTPAMVTYETKFAKEALGSKPRVHAAKITRLDPEDADPVDQWSRVSTFLGSIGLFRAFNDGEWPHLPDGPDFPKPGKFWDVVSRDGFKELGEALDASRVNHYAYISRKLQSAHPEAHAFIRRCIAWDPREREDFFMSGDALHYPVFKESDVLEFLDDPEGTRADFFLDLTTRVNVVVEADAMPSPGEQLPPPGTPKLTPTEPPVGPPPVRPRPLIATTMHIFDDASDLNAILEDIRRAAAIAGKRTQLVVFDLDSALIADPDGVAAKLHPGEDVPKLTDTDYGAIDLFSNMRVISVLGEDKIYDADVFSQINALAKDVRVMVQTGRPQKDMEALGKTLGTYLPAVHLFYTSRAFEPKGKAILHWSVGSDTVFFVGGVDLERASVRTEMDGRVSNVYTYHTRLEDDVVKLLRGKEKEKEKEEDEDGDGDEEDEEEEEEVQPADLPEACQEIKHVADVNVEDGSPYNAIEMVVAVGKLDGAGKALYIFDFDDTLATPPSKAFPGDTAAVAKEKMTRAVGASDGQLVLFGGGLYGPSNIKKIANLPGGRVYVITARSGKGVDAARKVLAAAGVIGVEVIGTGKRSGRTKAGEIARLLTEETADTVHFVDNSVAQREAVKTRVTTGANNLMVYNVSLGKYISTLVRGTPATITARPEIEVAGVAGASPLHAIDIIEETSGADDVYFVDFDHAIAAHEIEFASEEDIREYTQMYGADGAAVRLLHKAAESTPGIDLIGELYDPARSVNPRVYGPANLAKLETLPGKMVYIVDSEKPITHGWEDLTTEEFILQVLRGKNVTRARVVQQMAGETKGQIVSRLLRETPARTAHVVSAFEEDLANVEETVVGGADKVVLYLVDIAKYATQHRIYSLLQRI